MPSNAGDADIFESKRTSTSYQILVEIAHRQPAVSQQEIADEIGITSQAVSDYLQELIERDYVEMQGRGRYEITNEGVDWLISQTDALREFVKYVSGTVIEDVDVETAIATTDIAEGDNVSLTMRDGVLHAVPGQTGSATAVAVTDGAAGEDVGVTNFEGVIDYELGSVTILAIPPVQAGGSRAVDASQVRDRATNHDLVAVDSPEALSVARGVAVDPDIQFGTTRAVQDAATKGLSVLLLAVETGLSHHTDALREHNVRYEVIDPVEGR